MASERLLLVDDDESLRSALKLMLEVNGFQVSVADGAKEALQLIASSHFDVLLTDLHMPGPGDGLTVASAMRHANPEAVTLLLSAKPNLARATAAIIQQVDEVILKPVKAGTLIERITERLQGRAEAPAPVYDTDRADIATLLERELACLTTRWLAELARPPASAAESRPVLTAAERTEHLPEALRDIVFRLRYPQPIGTSTLFSMSALQHGARRRRQGFAASTLVEEARALQVSLFRTIEANQNLFNPAQIPTALMAIADEVNAQLLQAIQGYENEDAPEPAWGFR